MNIPRTPHLTLVHPTNGVTSPVVGAGDVLKNLEAQSESDLQKALINHQDELAGLHIQYDRLNAKSKAMGGDFSGPFDDLMDAIDNSMSSFAKAVQEIVDEQDRRDC